MLVCCSLRSICNCNPSPRQRLPQLPQLRQLPHRNHSFLPFLPLQHQFLSSNSNGSIHRHPSFANPDPPHHATVRVAGQPRPPVASSAEMDITDIPSRTSTGRVAPCHNRESRVSLHLCRRLSTSCKITFKSTCMVAAHSKRYSFLCQFHSTMQRFDVLRLRARLGQ